ncbi:MAG: hypothetical protein IJT91_07795 [Clostridia bacterium]|nr:hypothetical protein [Clostridia bacterium]
MKKHEKKKIKLNKKRIVISCVYAALSYAALVVRHFIPLKHPYFRQGAAVVSAGFLALTLFSLGKLFDREVRREIGRRISNLFMDFSEKVGKVIQIIRTKLGITERRKLRGTDEKSYFYDDDNKKKTSRGKPVKLRWKDMKTKSDKIRFLYISYIGRAIRDGYAFSNKRTPLETAEHMDQPDQGRRLTDMYCRARYAVSFDADDKDIDDLSDFVKTSRFER